MGFPNVDLYLVSRFIECFSNAKGNLDFYVSDIMEDRPDAERETIRLYLNGLRVTSDQKDRSSEKTLFVVPSWPMFDLPFPQIGVSLASEGTVERLLGDETGTKRTGTAIIGGVEVGFQDTEYGYWASGQWNVDVVCASKLEAVWLANLCRRFVLASFLDLDEMGVKEVTLSLADIRLEGEQLPVPVFGRRLSIIAGRVTHTWWEREYFDGVYGIGINKGLQ